MLRTDTCLPQQGAKYVVNVPLSSEAVTLLDFVMAWQCGQKNRLYSLAVDTNCSVTIGVVLF